MYNLYEIPKDQYTLATMARYNFQDAHQLKERNLNFLNDNQIVNIFHMRISLMSLETINSTLRHE